MTTPTSAHRIRSIVYVAPEDGVYRVHVSRYDDTTSGDYQLDVKIGDQQPAEVRRSPERQRTDARQ